MAFGANVIASIVSRFSKHSTNPFPLQHHVHLLHVGIGIPMNRSAMDIISELGSGQCQHADVADGAQIHEVAEVVLEDAFANNDVDCPLSEADKQVQTANNTDPIQSTIADVVGQFVWNLAD